MQLVLVGQPYSGKSTLFNEVVGYRTVASGAEHTHGRVEVDGEPVEVVDLPGIYSLQVPEAAEDPAVEHLIRAPQDTVFVNVIDASVLSRSLELTLQLIEVRRPLVVALNMVDESRRKGIAIDGPRLAELLGAPVVEIDARTGAGVSDLFRAAVRVGRAGTLPRVVTGPARIERALGDLEAILARGDLPEGLHRRFVAIKLVERDAVVHRLLEPHLAPADRDAVEARLRELEAAADQEAALLMSPVRHDLAFHLFEQVATVRPGGAAPPGRSLDDLLMHPVLGYLFLVLILGGAFLLVFQLGSLVEPVFVDGMERAANWLAGRLGEGTAGYAVAHGVVTGVGGGIGIVIPFLLPFFVVLAFLEDSGYLPRIAYLVDGLMHRIGLHGLSVVPILMGYGCSVPGVLATRILKSRRDRLITATLVTLVPCSARMTILFGLVGFFLSVEAALLIYAVNLLLLGLVGRMLALAFPEESPGLLLEIPRYHLPGARVLAAKTWYRLKEFVVIAWPILIVGSVLLELIHHYEWSGAINGALSPYTAGLLGFPAAVGTTLLFGLLRKELALVLLFTAVGTSAVDSVMTPSQILGYAFFVTFYVPCLATFAALARELGGRTAAAITAATLAAVSLLTALLRLAAPLLDA